MSLGSGAQRFGLRTPKQANAEATVSVDKDITLFFFRILLAAIQYDLFNLINTF